MIGKQLRKLRRSRALKQSDLAELLGVSRTAYTYYENDKRQPSPEMLTILADFFHVSIDFLSERTCYPGTTPKKDSAEALLLNRYRYVDKRGKEAIRESALHEYEINRELLGEEPGQYTFLTNNWSEEE